ncbi:MAG: glycoside hydrolase 15 protein [Chrysothrix sp. TS-e1954]|nr:MAG: glycoside hydrolase 15 protein [Chrysothrix sp. TS-e1954]
MYTMPSPKTLLTSLWAIFGTLGQACDNVTLVTDVPTDGTNLALQSYSYCSGTLNVTSYIKNLDYDKIVTLYYTNADNISTPLSAVQLAYEQDVVDVDGWEYWGSSTPHVNLDGITRMLNLTFRATDLGQTLTQTLNLPVNATGPPPTSSIIPAPYATPTGFSQDVTAFLAPSNGSEAGIAKTNMLKNFNVTGAADGTVIAAQSYTDPDYAYNWVRDASLTMDVVKSLYAAANGTSKTLYAGMLFAYAGARATEQIDPNLQTGLGEPKFNLDNSVFTGPWGRPQNDGPATAAITLIEFANAFLAAHGNVKTIKTKIYDSNKYPTKAPVLKDLMFVASNWSSSSFDLWEEEQSDHFYTRMVQHRAMVIGAAFATKLGDSKTASTLSAAASDIASTLPQFWDSIRQLILYENGPVLNNKYSYKDVAVLLAVIHGYANDGIFSYTDDQVLSSLFQIVTSFIPVFPIASTHFDTAGLPLGTPVGRYPEDTYNGTSTSSQGNPWYLCTLTVAEIFYRASTTFQGAALIGITNTSAPFWNHFAAGAASDFEPGQILRVGTSEFEYAIAALRGWGDAFVRTVKFYTPEGGHLSEEIDTVSGAPVGARDLTWSYAALLTAAFARAEARGDKAYVSELAGLGTAASSG